jgi:hypothetical protein
VLPTLRISFPCWILTGTERGSRGKLIGGMISGLALGGGHDLERPLLSE